MSSVLGLVFSSYTVEDPEIIPPLEIYIIDVPTLPKATSKKGTTYSASVYIIDNHKEDVFGPDKIRQEVYYIRKKGLEEHMRYAKLERKNYLDHLYGKIRYCLFLNKNDVKMQEYSKFVLSLLNK